MRTLLGITLILIAFLSNAQSVNQNILKNGRDRVVVGLDWTGWLQNSTDVEQKWYNRGFHIHLLADRPFNEQFSLGFGAGVAFANTYHNGTLFQDTAGVVNFSPISDTIEFSTNKFSFVALELPIEFKYFGKKNSTGNQFKLAVGAKVSYMIHNYSKYKGPGTQFGVYEDEIKRKEYDLPRLAKLQYGPSLRVGYGPVNFEVNYAITPLFEGDDVTSIHAIRAGISFNSL